MERQDPVHDTKRFGRFLRKVREERRFSLDAVEELSAAYPDRVTKSHLSRIENGTAEPSFRKLFVLSQIYGTSLSMLAEHYEIDLQRELVSVDVSGMPESEIESEAKKMVEAGRYTQALVILVTHLDRLRGAETEGKARADRIRHVRLGIVDCLVHLGRYESAKLETEELLGDAALSDSQRAVAMHFFVNCCYRLKRFTVAMMALEQARRDLEASRGAPSRLEADLAVLHANILVVTGRSEEAVPRYAEALELYESLPNPFEACRARVNLASALIEEGEYGRARSQIEAALLVAEASGYDRPRALAMSHMAVLAYRQDDHATAESWALRSNTVARSREFVSVVFRNCYYLMKIAQAKGDGPGARANEKTLRSLLSRIDDNLPEAEAYRAALAGGES